ncbi:UNVERIFIED_CONTAM: hypothetical protein GTU68_055746 [Idotea baltica]|nr:hypothetical protein [Idotea baltica]
MYEVLVDQFEGDRKLKERAEQLELASSLKEARQERREEIATVEEQKPKPVVEVEELPTPEPVKTSEPEQIVETEPVAEETPVEVKAEIKEEVKEEVKPKEVPPTIKETPIVEPVKTEPVKVEDVPAIVETKPIEPKKKPEPKAEKPTVEEDNGLKVLGKIDLSGISKKPKKAKKEQPKQAQRFEKPKQKLHTPKKTHEQKKTVVSAKKDEPKKAKPVVKEEDNFIKTVKHNLTGPKILGKIVLPTKAEKKPKSDNKGGSNDPNKKRPPRETKKYVKKGSGSHRGGGRRTTAKLDPQATVTEKAIQDKIKATMARLSGNKGSVGQRRRREKRATIAEKTAQQELEALKQKEGILEVTEFITVSELASLMDVGATDIITACMSLGAIVSINQRLDAEIIEIVGEEFGFEVKFINIAEEEDAEVEIEDDPADLVERSPIVTVMGHVDHGKTSLLDYIRKANVIDGEAGGITQHIGAYEVVTDKGKKITFLDTPGHEAFTAMRARGAKITDIAVIVIATDDAVMPQTKEAISHAQAAGVPMVFALNKIDKEGASPDKIKEQLSQQNILVEEWGGNFQSQEISAKKGLHIDELLEKILVESELLELKANPDRNAVGSVLEASLDKGRGYVTNVLVQTGTMRKGDVIVAGAHYGRVKAMFDERGNQLEEAGPSAPVLVLGLNGAPQAGERIKVYESESEAKEIAQRREVLQREQGRRAKKHITLEEIGRRLALDSFQELNLIVKGDVDGSVEALSDSLIKLSTEEIQINVIHKSVGQITETDVLLATASDAIIVGFQVRPSMQARKLAEKEDIDIRMYSIIYDAIEEIKSAMKGLMKPKFEEKVVCNIQVRNVFKISKVGTIAGCYVLDGKVSRNTKVRLIRDGIVKFTGELASLKRFKDDAKEVNSGYECGLNIKNYNDIKVDDIIEGYENVEVKM